MPSPFALPLMVERFREKLTTEKLTDRLDRMLKDMEKEAVRVEDAAESAPRPHRTASFSAEKPGALGVKLQ